MLLYSLYLVSIMQTSIGAAFTEIFYSAITSYQNIQNSTVCFTSLLHPLFHKIFSTGMIEGIQPKLEYKYLDPDRRVQLGPMPCFSNTFNAIVVKLNYFCVRYPFSRSIVSKIQCQHF